MAKPAAASGAFTLVLHCHTPYCRRAGRRPQGEQWLHEAAAETLVPLLNALYDLLDEGVMPHVTICLTPILVEQLADGEIIDQFQEYLLDRIAAARVEVARLEALEAAAAAHAPLGLAEAVALQAAQQVERGRAAEQGTPLAERSAEALGELGNRVLAQGAATAEPIAADPLASAPATSDNDVPEWPLGAELPGGRPTVAPAEPAPDYIAEWPDPQRLYLARWYRDWYAAILRSFVERFDRDIVRAFRALQERGAIEIATGMATHCYAPLLACDSSIYAQLATGIDSHVRHFGRRPRAIWLPADAHRPVDVGERALWPGAETLLALEGIGCLLGEAQHAAGAPAYAIGGSGVAVIGGSEWSAGLLGYAGQANYRDSRRSDELSGLQYWRVGGAGAQPSASEYWQPEWAEQHVASHAERAADLVERQLQEQGRAGTGPGLVCASYDARFFGHVWFEGIAWLKAIMRRLARSATVRLMTASEYLAEYPPGRGVRSPEGVQPGQTAWLQPETVWMGPLIHGAERCMQRLVAQHPQARGDQALALGQLGRELLLLQSGDWPLLIATGQAHAYGQGRFAEHLARFYRLLAALESGDAGEVRALAAQYGELDNPFPGIDYRVFGERETQLGAT
jgi:1,4-alpha-glucan branching enzyme